MSASPGPVGPCYEYSGDSWANTFHIVKNGSGLDVFTSAVYSNGTWCTLANATVSFTGSDAEFSNNKFGCALSSTASYLIDLTANNQTTSGFEIKAFNSSGSAIVFGTNLGITYACFGV
jgi:hypothetical protein